MNKVKKNGKSLFMSIFLIAGILISSWVYAEDFIVTLGENKVFSDYNFDDIDVSSSSRPEIEASSDGQHAIAGVFIDEWFEVSGHGERGIVNSQAGVIFQVQEGPNGETEAKATISMTFSYTAEVDFKPTLGSVEAWVDVARSGFPARTIRCIASHIGSIYFHEQSGYDKKSDTVTMRCENYLLNTETTYAVVASPHVDLHAGFDGATGVGYGPNVGRVEVTIHEIKVLFTPEEPRPPIAIFNYDPSKPQAGESVNFLSTSYDPNNDDLSYFWSIQDINDGTTLETFDTESFSYIFTKDTAYIVNLIVSDGILTDETSQIVSITIPEPTVTPCTTQLSVEMLQLYQVCYDIKNNAKVPIVVNLNIEESRENLNQTLLWDPFTKDPEPKSSTIQVAIPADQPLRLWFPDNDTYLHKWYWINNDSWWMNNLQYAILFLDAFSAVEFDAIDQVLESMKVAFSRIQIKKVEAVQYRLEANGSWWSDASVATYPLTIPDVIVTLHVPKGQKDSFNNMLIATSRALYATEIASVLAGPDWVGISLGLPFAIIETGELRRSRTCYQEALDPPDYDYSVLVEPQPISWPELNDIPDDSPSKPFMNKMLDILSLQKAHAHSLFKYEGAAIDGDAIWKAAQMEQVHKYSRLMAEKYLEALDLFQELVPNLPEITPEMIAKGKQMLINEGLPQVEKNILTRELGFDQVDFDKLTAALSSSDNAWPTSYNVLTNLLLTSIIQANDTAFNELETLINIKVNELGESIHQPSLEDLEILERMKADIEQLMAVGDYSEALLQKIEALRDAHEELLKHTNNSSALEVYNETLTNAFMSLETDAFTSIPRMGDITGNGEVDLADAILGLQVLVGLQQSSTLHKETAINGDEKFGLEEVIYILQKVSGHR
jgi:PKD repeat protein